MIKRQSVVFGFAVLMIVAAIFTLAGCGGDDPSGSVKEIPVKLIPSNNNGIAPSSLQFETMNRNIADGVLLSVETNFATYDAFYGKLGEKIGSGIPPSKFILRPTIISLYSNDGNRLDLVTSAENQYYDFTKGQSFDIGNVPAGVTCSAIVFEYYIEELEFPWPSGWTHSTSNYKDFAVTDGKIVIDNQNPQLLQPVWIQSSFLTIPLEAGNVGSIVYGGNTRKIYNMEAVPLQDIDPTLKDDLVNNFTGGQHGNAAVIVPFTPITVPDSASSVTFNISWDVRDIIEQYQGPDKTDNTDDDILVLKKGWWNGLHISASVQQ